MGSASCLADGHPFSGHPGEHVQGCGGSVKNQKRFEGDAPERDKLVDVEPTGQSTLNKSYVS